jgi:poly-gamma-glutamate synthase PgsB/CapB
MSFLELFNQIPSAIWVIGAIWLVLVTYLIIEYQVHRAILRKIPIRVHVNGTRGKTSMVRLIAAGLRAGGKRAFAKTSGTLTSVTNANGYEFPVFRFSQPNIIEQMRVIRRISRSKPEAIVIECMALQPRFQALTETHMVRATHGVITNARPDHLDVMGPTDRDVALALAGSTPIKAHLYTAEHDFIDVFEHAAADRQSTVHHISEVDIKSVTEAELNKFQYSEHAENVALALKVCGDLGVEREIALEGMMMLKPEPGATQIHRLEFHGRDLVFINAFAANDPESTRRIWELSVEHYDEGFRRIAVVNCRADRAQRSRQLAEVAATWSRTDHFIVIGTGTMLFLRAANKAGISAERLTVKESASAADVIETILELAGSKAVIVGMANIKGPGGIVARFFANRSSSTEHL